MRKGPKYRYLQASTVALALGGEIPACAPKSDPGDGSSTSIEENSTGPAISPTTTASESLSEGTSASTGTTGASGSMSGTASSGGVCELDPVWPEDVQHPCDIHKSREACVAAGCGPFVEHMPSFTVEDCGCIVTEEESFCLAAPGAQNDSGTTFYRVVDGKPEAIFSPTQPAELPPGWHACGIDLPAVGVPAACACALEWYYEL